MFSKTLNFTLGLIGMRLIRVSRHDQNTPPILFASMPKSAGTSISETVSKLSGMPRKNMVLGHGAHQFCPIALERYARTGVVSQAHISATPFTENMIDKYNMKVVVISRDIASSLVSLADHFDDVATRDPRLKMSSIWHQPENYFSLAREEKLNAVVHMNIDFVCRFIDSWRRSRVKTFNVTYEEFLADKSQTIFNIMRHCELETPPLEIIDNLFLSGITSRRMNVGIMDRAKELPDESRTLIEEFKEAYSI